MIIKSRSGNSLFSNTLMLYILTFSNYFFNFITVPYQTRILGPVRYGNLGFATSMMVYFQLILDFGFLLSATDEVAKNQKDKKKLGSILTEVSICKVFLMLLCFVALMLMCSNVDRLKSDPLLFILYFISVAINSFIPDFLYRGLEEMKAITVRSVLIKMFFTIMIFILLKEPEQYHIVPLMNLIGNLGAVIGVYIHLKKKMGIRFEKVSISQVLNTFKKSSTFFYSRIASTVYSATNTFILGFLYGESSPIVGYFSTADKLITTGKQAITPVTDSLYPYMVSHKDFKLAKKLLLIGTPVLTAGCIFLAVFAEPICVILFGEAFRESSQYLRLLVPIVWCAFPGMMFGFPILSPMGLSKYANISNIIGAIVQIVLLVIIYLCGMLDATSICIATCITEVLTVSFRVLVVWFNRDRLRISNE